jgi:hypothetical protein
MSLLKSMLTVRNASGTINQYRRLLVQFQLVREDDSPWSDWIDERALVKPVAPSVPRLSGNKIRDVLYLGTAPVTPLLSCHPVSPKSFLVGMLSSRHLPLSLSGSQVLIAEVLTT